MQLRRWMRVVLRSWGTSNDCMIPVADFTRVAANFIREKFSLTDQERDWMDL
jgi:hypothetical protein